ncbi:MAG: DUF1588 domain-containing protein [Verrucomicrobiales bacterium]
MRSLLNLTALGWLIASQAFSSPALLESHCSKCHSEEKSKGDFELRMLGDRPTPANSKLWSTSLDYVKTREMPPEKDSKLTGAERLRLVEYLEENVRNFYDSEVERKPAGPRRLNNRELANSISDVLMIEDVGTHQPLSSLLGDTRQDGFDTNGDALGMSQFHLDQYIWGVRKVIDATIFSGERPATLRVVVSADDLRMTSRNQSRRAERANRTRESIDLLDIRLRAYCDNFQSVPDTGRYRIKIRATGVDRGVYDEDETGIYTADPIRLSVHLGDRTRTFALPDGEEMEIELDEWLAAGTRMQMSYPTDGLRQRGNANFKFQYRIAHDHIKQHDPELYAKITESISKKKNSRTARDAGHWSHWTDYWQGPRPRLFGAEIEGPIYDSWPPRRQTALLGEHPSAADAAEILRPIAKRAWRRELRDGELTPIIDLVRSRVKELGDIEALKEGIVAILVSPSFLLINPGEQDPADRFATKLSYFLASTSPSSELREAVKSGSLGTFETVRREVQQRFEQGSGDEFTREFPHAWLQLDRINFMAPDPDNFRLYDRKRLSEDMIAEAKRFFGHMIENNLPITEFISADYSFINADLANVYGAEGVPQDSQLRRYTFTDGRRGGLLGMGAFLTLTADSLGTSPIHRAVYVMENFLGIHPVPPPPGVEISEPDVRQAKTIKEILATHTSEPNCASCHRSIDPYGYAFENFDPMGAWRDRYTMQIAKRPPRKELAMIEREDRERAKQGLPPLAKPWENKPIAVDASAKFRNGSEYHDIVGFRQLMLTGSNRDRFVRCMITKMLTYANGVEPDDYVGIERILSVSADNGYRIIDTIAAVIDSPLFREP